MTGEPAIPRGPRQPHRRLRGVSDVEALVAASCWPFATGPTVACGDRRVGLEAEAPALERRPDGSPGARLRITALAGMLDHAFGASPVAGPGWPTATGSVVTLEPGGQVEVSTPVAASAGAALVDLDGATAELDSLLASAGAVLVPLGSDPWHALDEVPQQLDAPRYRAMHDAFRRRGGPEGPGARMMRLTASLQVNLDLGMDEETALERWHVATLAAPVLSAAFRSSPGAARTRAWQALDPTRSGPGPGLAVGSATGRAAPVELLARAALDADVLLHHGPSGDVVAGWAGRSFRAWLADGGPGGPTAADLRLHLTTLWHDVRVRGFLEVRTIDALPRALQPAPVAVLCGLLLDPRARTQVLELLEPWAARYEALATLAAGPGVAHPRICALAVELCATALEGARRVLPAHDLWAAAVAEDHLDARTMRGLAPVDELLRLLPEPAAALAWASAPPTNRPLTTV